MQQISTNNHLNRRHIFKADGLYKQHAGGLWCENQTFFDTRDIGFNANCVR